MEQTDLLNRVDEILQRSKQNRRHEERQGEYRQESSARRIINAMSGQEQRQPKTAGQTETDLISLTAKYSRILEAGRDEAYRKKVEIEQLEQTKNDWKMRVEIIERKLAAEQQRQTEREVSLGKAASERESTARRINHLSEELQKMQAAVQDRLEEMEEADRDVVEEISRERNLYESVCMRIEQERQQFLQDLNEEFEEEKRQKESELYEAEQAIRQLSDANQSLREMYNDLKNGIVISLKATQERTLHEEHEQMIRIERDFQIDMTCILADIEALKKQESECKNKLSKANATLEDSRVSANKTIQNMKAAASDLNNKLRDQMSEAKQLESQMAKKEQAYQQLYDQIEKEEADYQNRLVNMKNEQEQIEHQQQETIERIKEHICKGVERLEKIEFATNEFIQENAKLKEKNERTVTNLKIGLEQLVKGVVVK